MEVDVEILDVNDAEARALLLSIDPLAALAETQTPLQQRLLELTPPIPPTSAPPGKPPPGPSWNRPPIRQDTGSIRSPSNT